MANWLEILTVFTIIIPIMEQAEGCNEAVCGSVVSKCLLTQSCRCDLKNCTCCKECYGCLGDLFSECCTCVDMCPQKNDTGTLNKKSHVEEFLEKVPSLFKVLTEFPDPQDRWSSITYAIDLDPSVFLPKKEVKLHMQSAEHDVQETESTKTSVPIPKPIVAVLNCTVAFMSQCMSWTKCRSSCQSMGAASYRWFHDGCCECVGETCINYGINESRCRKCSLNEELPGDFVYDDSLEYGEDADEEE